MSGWCCCTLISCRSPCPQPKPGAWLSRAGGNGLEGSLPMGTAAEPGCLAAPSPQPQQEKSFFSGWPLPAVPSLCPCVAGGTPCCPSLLLPCFCKSAFRAPTCASESLIDGAQVGAGFWRLAVGDRQQPDDGHVRVQLLGAGLCQLTRGRVPAGALQEQAVDVAAHFGLLRQLLHRLLHDLPRGGAAGLSLKACPGRLSPNKPLNSSQLGQRCRKRACHSSQRGSVG